MPSRQRADNAPMRGPNDWKEDLRAAVRQPRELLARLDLDPVALEGAEAGHQLFPLKAPPAYLAQVRPGDASDPLLRQLLPLASESASPAHYSSDPVGDEAAMPRPGVIHKYRGRVLLVATGACAIHCRYCFRRHFPYDQATAAGDDWRAAARYVAEDPSIREVILSGGDPLMLATPRLQRLTERLRLVPHVKRLRIHSRIPAVLPSRIDDAFCHWLHGLPWQKVLVCHVNHAAELGPAAAEALARLREAGVTLFNQAVLLRGVNDSVESLHELSETLFDLGVVPYYLHLLDRVQGAAHFEVDEPRARRLMLELREGLPGFLVPRLVREQAGAPYKLPVL